MILHAFIKTTVAGFTIQKCAGGRPVSGRSGVTGDFSRHPGRRNFGIRVQIKTWLAGLCICLKGGTLLYSR
jgi:hypothetical protein